MQRRDDMTRRNSILLQIGDVSCVIWQETLSLIQFIGEAVSACADAVRRPRKIRWRETLFYMNMCGSDGLPITALICFLTGIILGYQCAVQMHKYGADAFLPGLVGCSVVRELGPMMVAIVATGRAGSAFAAEIGTMKVSEEIDAMRTMGFLPERFLVIPKLIAMTLTIPMLTVIGDVMGILGGMIVGHTSLGMPVQTYYQQTVEWVAPEYFFESIFKSVVFAVVITLTGCWRGFRAGNDAIAVGKATTSAVVISILFIILCDTFLAHVFNTIFFG